MKADETLGFLIADTARTFRRTFAPMVGRHGINVGLIPFLRIVSERDAVTFRELSDAVHMRGPTTVQAVREMERLGLVRREPHPSDARKINLFMTAKGRRAWERVLPEVAAINRRAFEHISASERAELKRLLRTVRKNVA